MKAYPEPVATDIIFDCFSITRAWGYQMTGFFIDTQGGVYRYKRKGTPWHPKPIVLEKQRFYDKNELLSKFTDKSIVLKIDPAILKSKIDLIEIADAGPISNVKKKVADGGQSLCIAYRYSKGQPLYRPIALGSYGVTEQTLINHSVAAQTLMSWLTNDIANHISANSKAKSQSKQTP